ncbi:hypothetical protein JCM10207_005965 [Rhodosporidiobolus poonsookiae]
MSTSTNPIAIGASSSAPPSSSIPPALAALLATRTKADSTLQSPSLAQELGAGEGGPAVGAARDALAAVVQAADDFLDKVNAGGKCSAEHEARAEYCHAWAASRLGEYDGTPPQELPVRLRQALARYQRAGELLHLPPPPALESVPSVTRPQRQTAGAVDLPAVQAWAAEMLAEWARTETTLAFSSVLGENGETVVQEEELADLLDAACRRNVQALFTPVDPLSAAEDPYVTNPSSTVLGNARLLRDLSTLLPYTQSSSLWSRRLAWSTHVADVRFVTASMSATALVDAASAHAAVLANPNVTPAERKEVKAVLEKLSRRIAPHERTQGNVLLWLGRVMLDAVGALYLGRTESFQAEKRRQDEEMLPDGEEEPVEEGKEVEVPENDLVRETRQVLIRAAALFENAYASILRSPPSSRRRKTELRLLRRLESTYLSLEPLDNSSPSVLELRSQRIERALFINERLVALGDGSGRPGVDEEEDGESDREVAAEEEEEESSDEEIERVVRKLGGQRIA